MNRSITPEETRQLFDFCEKKGVKYYDVQTELVDHLASDLEEQWKTNGKLGFEEALYNCFKGFGIYGFRLILERKESEINRKYRKLHLEYILDFLTWPKIILTFSLACLFYLLSLKVKDIQSLLMLVPLLLFLFGYGYLSFEIIRREYRNDFKGKEMLLVKLYDRRRSNFIFYSQFIPASISIFANTMNVFGNPNNPVEELTLDNYFNSNSLLVFSISFLYILFSIGAFGEFFHVGPKIKKYINLHFPQFAT